MNLETKKDENGFYWVSVVYPRMYSRVLETMNGRQSLDQILDDMSPQDRQNILASQGKEVGKVDAYSFLRFLKRIKQAFPDTPISDEVCKRFFTHPDHITKLLLTLLKPINFFFPGHFSLLDLFKEYSKMSSDNIVTMRYYPSPGFDECLVTYDYTQGFKPTKDLCEANKSFLRWSPLYKSRDAKPLDIQEISCGIETGLGRCIYRLEIPEYERGRQKTRANAMNTRALFEQLNKEIVTLQELTEVLKQQAASAERLAGLEFQLDLSAHDLANKLTGLAGAATVMKVWLDNLLPVDPKASTPVPGKPYAQKRISSEKFQDFFKNRLETDPAYIDLVYKNLDNLSSNLSQLEYCAGLAVEHMNTFRTLTRPGKKSPKPFNINPLVESIGKTILRGKGGSVDLNLDLDKSLWNMTGSPVDVSSIIFNLYLNAWKAMQGKGRISASSRNERIENMDRLLTDAFYDNASPPNIGPYVHLSFSDDGPGLPPKVKEGLFKEIITTDEDKELHGRGLYSIGWMVKNHGGFVRCPQVQRGTTFEIYLPAKDEK